MTQNKVVEVSKMEFKLDNGDIFPIIPPLEKEMTAEEFQIHYDRALNIIESIKDSRGNNKNS
jgi:hypothetical protein